MLISIGKFSVQALCLRGKHQRIRCLCLQFLWLGRPNGFIVFLTRHLVCLSDADSSVLPCTLSCPNMHGNFQSSWYLAGRNVQLHHIILLAMARSTQNQKTLSIHACVEYHLSSLAAPWQAVLWPSSYTSRSASSFALVLRSQGLMKLFSTSLQRLWLAAHADLQRT